ncbi:hypothetical protein UJ101_01185 [Flavobacteriaceae bacterium UJ101]|nr:hypothetical protein UJ101_01185 [Flavobacteriaceae bacterium UJ101]
MKINSILFILGFTFLVSCNEKPMAKPRGHVRLEYPQAHYKNFDIPKTPYSFDYNTFAQIKTNPKRNYWYTIEYKKMNATVYLSYFPVKNNLKSLLKDSEELLDTHTIKANSANDSQFSNSDEKVYGLITRLGGETASNIQFHFTDSVQHFLSGSLYFHTHPKPDSLKPAIDYISKDIKHLAESLHWK